MRLQYMGINKVKEIVRSRRRYVFNPVAEVENEKDIKFFLRTGIFVVVGEKAVDPEPRKEEKVQCAANTKSGTRCKKAAVKGSEFCAVHGKQK